MITNDQNVDKVFQYIKSTNACEITNTDFKPK